MLLGSFVTVGANCNNTDTDLFLGFVGTAWAFSIKYVLESGITARPLSRDVPLLTPAIQRQLLTPFG